MQLGVMRPRVVWAKWVEGMTMSIAQMFGSGPNMTVCCGSCPGVFKKRIQMVDYPCVVCPYCRAINKLNIVMTTVGGGA